MTLFITTQANKMDVRGSIEPADADFDPSIPHILPHREVYSIQVGDTLFRLSGASLSSDAPSYFTTYFSQYKDAEESERPILYIDRSSKVFHNIALHLQGYYVLPQDESMFQYLRSDAQYYHLPRLSRQIENSAVFCHIGGEEFCIPYDIFKQAGDYPNFFTVGFKPLFQGEEDVRTKRGLIRPPPLAPPTITNRSSRLFRELLAVLRNGHIEITSPQHRAQLIKECRYYRFRALEQKLIEHEIVNTVGEGGVYEELVLNLVDIKPKEIDRGRFHFVYKRPWIDEPKRPFVFQVKKDQVQVLPANGTRAQVSFKRQATFDSFQTVCNAVAETVQLDSSLTVFASEVKNADLKIDGQVIDALTSPVYLVNSQWRFRYTDGLILELVKGEGYSDIQNQNRMRQFV